MPVIATMNPPRTAEELRQTIFFLLEDYFGYSADICRQGEYTEYYPRDSEDDATPSAYVLVVDADRHRLAYQEFRKFRDDAPNDDGETESAEEVEAEEEPAEPAKEEESESPLMVGQPKTVEGFRRALTALIFDHFRDYGSVQRTENTIEFWGSGLNITIGVIDNKRHTGSCNAMGHIFGDDKPPFVAGSSVTVC